MRFWFLLLTGVGLTLCARGAEVRDLDEGLGYLRLVDIGGESFSAPDAPLIIDLRQAAAGGAVATTRLRGLFQGSSLRIVLISPNTAPEIRDLLSPRPPLTLVIGARTTQGVDIEVSVSPDNDRKAFHALDDGVALTDLANPPYTKSRRDEAAMVAARRSPAGEAVPPNPGRPPRPEAPADRSGERPGEAAEPPATPPADPVLQRAVQLYRGLRALGRI